jgi:hypothetical protein
MSLPIVGVKDTEKIDAVTHNPMTNEIVLVMVEDREHYTVDRQMLELQDKINTYLSYAADGQLAKDYPDWAGRPVVIRIDYHHPPSVDELQFLAEIEEALKERRIKFISKLVEPKKTHLRSPRPWDKQSGAKHQKPGGSSGQTPGSTPD